LKKTIKYGKVAIIFHPVTNKENRFQIKKIGYEQGNRQAENLNGQDFKTRPDTFVNCRVLFD